MKYKPPTEYLSTVLRFQKETGVILDQNKNPLLVVDGTLGEVEFPSGLIWELHRASRGIVYALSHVHPPEMFGLSKRDKTTMRSWVRALHPFPFRMITISQVLPRREEEGALTSNRPVDSFKVFQETCYLGTWEAKETWEQRGKSSPRNLNIEKEWQRHHSVDPTVNTSSWYGDVLINKSYGTR